MNISITPPAVTASADTVADVGTSFAKDTPPAAPGNEGFATSQAIATWAEKMSGAAATTATDTADVAQKLHHSAGVLKDADDACVQLAQALQKAITT